MVVPLSGGKLPHSFFGVRSGRNEEAHYASIDIIHRFSAVRADVGADKSVVGLTFVYFGVEREINYARFGYGIEHFPSGFLVRKIVLKVDVCNRTASAALIKDRR